MALREKLASDLKDAMRSKNELVRDTLRMLKTDLDRRELELGKPLDEGEEIAILARAVKTRKESAEQYDAGGRKDLSDRERKEISIIEAYLPKSMDEDEARQAIAQVAQDLGLSGKASMGQLMKEVTSRYRGQIDGKTASRLAAEVLAE
ncbi:MAG: GatB/YqeY domain-containing protein [Myxococcales bacterium]|nr:GatB/YqeY domain-containing protein [Myxococcales bacterium]